MEEVALLLVKHLAKALRLHSIETAESEPCWLRPEQYREENGRIRLLEDQVCDIYIYATRNRLRPLGLVARRRDGDCYEFINVSAVRPEYREFASELFRAHAKRWFNWFRVDSGEKN